MANLVWIDLEMTGLDPERHRICEIATIITTDELEIVAEGPSLVIHLTDDELGEMDAWCVEHHGKSGLTQRIRESTISLEEAERQTLDFIKEHCAIHTSPLCGNSIWQDRRFIARFMKDLDSYLHYRIIDVSTIKELVKRWYPPNMRANLKQASHRALEDIRESIEELRYYREHILVPPADG